MSYKARGMKSLVWNLMENMIFTRLTHLSGKMFHFWCVMINFLKCFHRERNVIILYYDKIKCLWKKEFSVNHYSVVYDVTYRDEVELRELIHLVQLTSWLDIECVVPSEMERCIRRLCTIKVVQRTGTRWPVWAGPTLYMSLWSVCYLCWL